MIMETKIAKRTNISSEIERVIVGIGPCRSGTTLLLRAFAELGFHSWYQPFKAIYRGITHSLNTQLNIDNTNGKTIFIKETLGPYTSAETSLNALRILLETGLSKDKIQFISLVRNPYTTIASSVLKFSKFKAREDVVDISIKSFQSLYNIHQFAIKEGITHHSFVYEAWNKNDPEEVLASLLSNLGVLFRREQLQNWSALDSLAQLPKIHMLNEPGFYHHTDFSEKVKRYKNISFYSRSEVELQEVLTSEQIKTIQGSQVPSIYNYFKTRAEIELKTQISNVSVFL